MTPDARPVLVVTQLEDSTADIVISLLHERDVPVVRLNLGDFPTGVTMDAHFDGNGIHGLLTTATRTLDVSRVRSVLHGCQRAPRPGARLRPGAVSAASSPACPERCTSIIPGGTATPTTNPRNWPRPARAACRYFPRF